MRPPYNLHAFGVPSTQPFGPVRRRRGPSLGGLGTVVTAPPKAPVGPVTKVAQRYADGLKILVSQPGRAPILVPVNVKNVGAGVEVPSLGVTAPNGTIRVALVTQGNRIFWRVATALSGKQPSTRDIPYAAGQTKPPAPPRPAPAAAAPTPTPAPAPVTPLVSVAPLKSVPAGGGVNDRFQTPPEVPPPAEDFIEPEAGPEPIVPDAADNVRRLIPPTGVAKSSFAPAVPSGAFAPASQAVVTMVPQRSGMNPLLYVAGAAVAGVLLFIIWQRRSASVPIYVAPQTSLAPAGW